MMHFGFGRGDREDRRRIAGLIAAAAAAAVAGAELGAF